MKLSSTKGNGKSVPPGIEVIQNCYGRRSYNWYKASVLILTFLCYAGYHASRKPPSIVKSVLKGDGSFVSTNKNQRPTVYKPHTGFRRLLGGGPHVEVDIPAHMRAGWAPFNGPDGQSLLGEVDLAFLGAYAIGMFFAGHLGDRLDLRWFLSAGMLGSGVFIALLGMGYFWDIHALSYYIIVSIIAGLFQSTGWPSVVSIVANWSGKGKRGLVMGIWNAHTSVGNILGTVVSAALLASGWGYSFVVLGCVMIALAALMFVFLVVSPSDVGVNNPGEVQMTKISNTDESTPLVSTKQDKQHEEALSFVEAWRIPGVASYAFCLFFAKLIAYTFLYWLPYYIKSTPIENRMLSPKEAGDLSVLFDIGGVAGGVMAGHLSDKSGASAVVSVSFTLLAVPSLWMYRNYGHISFSANVILMMLSGFFVNGPYALITTAVSADLGTHDSLAGNAKALATVSAIIDGMGSIGAALGPMLTGYISEKGGFDLVFMMLYISAFTAGLLILKLAARELALMRSNKK